LYTIKPSISNLPSYQYGIIKIKSLDDQNESNSNQISHQPFCSAFSIAINAANNASTNMHSLNQYSVRTTTLWFLKIPLQGATPGTILAPPLVLTFIQSLLGDYQSHLNYSAIMIDIF